MIPHYKTGEPAKKGDRVRRYVFQKWEYGTVPNEVHAWSPVSVLWDGMPQTTSHYGHNLELVSRGDSDGTNPT